MDILLNNIGAIIATLVTWLITHSRYRAEVKQLERNGTTTAIENDIKLSSHYQELLDDLKSRYEGRYKEYEELMQRKVQQLELEVKSKEKQIKTLQQENKLKDRKIKLLEQEIEVLKIENNALRGNGSND